MLPGTLLGLLDLDDKLQWVSTWPSSPGSWDTSIMPRGCVRLDLEDPVSCRCFQRSLSAISRPDIDR